jgi:hypothetical protein
VPEKVILIVDIRLQIDRRDIVEPIDLLYIGRDGQVDAPREG